MVPGPRFEGDTHTEICQKAPNTPLKPSKMTPIWGIS